MEIKVSVAPGKRNIVRCRNALSNIFAVLNMPCTLSVKGYRFSKIYAKVFASAYINENSIFLPYSVYG